MGWDGGRDEILGNGISIMMRFLGCGVKRVMPHGLGVGMERGHMWTGQK